MQKFYVTKTDEGHKVYISGNITIKWVTRSKFLVETNKIQGLPNRNSAQVLITYKIRIYVHTHTYICFNIVREKLGQIINYSRELIRCFMDFSLPNQSLAGGD